MKEIEYKSEPENTVLEEGIENGVNYVIKSLGTHPCCYIGVPIRHPLSGFDYDLVPIHVHGGLTYANEGTDEYLPKGYYWYGWDYAHAGDFVGYDSNYANREDNKKYTLKDLKDDVWDATRQMKKLKELAEAIYMKGKTDE